MKLGLLFQSVCVSSIAAESMWLFFDWMPCYNGIQIIDELHFVCQYLTKLEICIHPKWNYFLPVLRSWLGETNIT